MSDIPPEPPRASSTSTARTKPRLDPQGKALAHAIASAERTIRSVLTCPDLLLALAPLGYNELELNKGVALVATLQPKFKARQEALAVAKLATKARAMARDIAKAEFAAFRTAIQALGPGLDSADLGANGPIPDDASRLCTLARSAYNRGLDEPYASVLSKAGFGRQRLTQALGVLDKVDTAENAREAAASKSKAATATCEVAVEGLDAWVGKLRSTANSVLKNRPALLELLNG